jgi:hypothetical protein
LSLSDVGDSLLVKSRIRAKAATNTGRLAVLGSTSGARTWCTRRNVDMRSKAVIRHFLLLFCAALAAGMLTSGVRANPTDMPQQNGASMVVQPNVELSTGERDQLESLSATDAWLPGGGSSALLLIDGGVALHNATPPEPVAMTSASSLVGDSAAVPLPPAAWTGLSGLVGLGLIGFARNLRRLTR